MPKPSAAIAHLPATGRDALVVLGENFRLARLRRNETLKSWSAQAGVSVPTLMRIEKGDPSVAIGLLTSVLCLLGREGGLPELAAPAHDVQALQLDVQAALDRNGVRTRPTSKRRR